MRAFDTSFRITSLDSSVYSASCIRVTHKVESLTIYDFRDIATLENASHTEKTTLDIIIVIQSKRV